MGDGIGTRYMPADEARGCGIGEGAECCIFLTVDGNGYGCEQRSKLALGLIERRESMTSKRAPSGDFPACQQEGRTA